MQVLISTVCAISLVYLAPGVSGVCDSGKSAKWVCDCRLAYECSDTVNGDTILKTTGTEPPLLIELDAGSPRKQNEYIAGKDDRKGDAKQICTQMCRGRGVAVSGGYSPDNAQQAQGIVREWLARALHWKNNANANKCCFVYVAHRPRWCHGAEDWGRSSLLHSGSFKYFNYAVSNGAQSYEFFSTHNCTVASSPFPNGLTKL